MALPTPDDKDKDLWSSLGGSKESSLSDILKADAVDRAKESKAKSQEEEKKKKMVIAGFAAAAVLIGGGFAAYTPISNALNLNDTKVQKETPGTTTVPLNTDAGDQPFYIKEGSKYPVSFPKWMETQAGYKPAEINKDAPDYYKKLISTFPFYSVESSTLQSAAGGWTSDPKKFEDKNGFPNFHWTAWLLEDFNTQSTDIVERFINPSYGAWSSYQSSGPDADNKKEFNANLFQNVFTEKYVKDNFSKPDKSFLPVFADWNNNGFKDYTNKELVGFANSKFYGEVTNARIKFKKSADRKTLSAVAVYNVKYTSWTTDKEKVSVNGVLTVNFVTNELAKFNENSWVVLVNGASLKINK